MGCAPERMRIRLTQATSDGRLTLLTVGFLVQLRIHPCGQKQSMMIER